MTRAEKLMEIGPTKITLTREEDGECRDAYSVEFRPQRHDLPLGITCPLFDEGDLYNGHGVFLTRENAIELADFIRRIFIEDVGS